MTTLHFSPSASRTSAAATTPSSSLAMSTTQLGADLDSLAQHMRHCASTRSRPSRFQGLVDDAHSLASPRIVTVVSVTTLLAVAAASVVVSVFSLV